MYCSAKQWFFRIHEAVENGETIPLISKFTVDSIVLVDGSQYKIDAVIFCTGYSREFPFLDESCHLDVTDKRITPLYKDIVHTEFPSSLFFVGLKEFNDYVGTATVQVRFITSVLLGTADLPSVDDMNQEIQKEIETALLEGKPPKSCHYLGFNHANYCAELERMGHLEKSRPSVWKAIQSLIEDFVVKNNFHILRDIQYNIIDDDNFERVYPAGGK